MIDTVDWTIDDIDSHCEKHKPDIIVIDQLDKINVKGTFGTKFSSGIYESGNFSDEKMRSEHGQERTFHCRAEDEKNVGIAGSILY